MSSIRNITESRKVGVLMRPILAASATSLTTLFLAFGSLVGGTTTEANACACGCSVFDVSGLDMMPQEQESGGRIFFEYWSQDQTQNYVGSSKAPAALNGDKEIKTQWYNVGLSYNFNRDWGIMIRVPITADRSLTTETDYLYQGQIQTFNAKSFGDLEIMGVYTGFFPDMSTGLIFGLKLPTGTYTALGMDRDNQIGTGSTDLILGASTAACSAATMPGSISRSSCGASRSRTSRPLTRRASSMAASASYRLIIRACRSMALSASSTTIGTMCSASTRSRRLPR